MKLYFGTFRWHVWYSRGGRFVKAYFMDIPGEYSKCLSYYSSPLYCLTLLLCSLLMVGFSYKPGRWNYAAGLDPIMWQS